MKTRMLVVMGLSGLGLSNSLWAASIIDRGSAERIPKQYIVTLKAVQESSGLDAANYVIQQADRLSQVYGVTVFHQYSKVLTGMAIKADDTQLEALAQDSSIARIEANKYVRINATENSATWGIDRIDSRKGTDGKYNYTSTGKGVHAYIIDTGTRITHSEFKGRTGEGFSSIDDAEGPNDCHGHGTHVSATIGGTIYGVAKNVTVHPVRVLDCEGSGDDAGVIAGIEWMAKNAIFPAVANMSLGGDVSESLDDSVRSAIKGGVVFAVAAGNENGNACKSSPADVKEAITVGATTSSDNRASFSNFGECVDVFAPGQNITSAWLSNDKATNTISGTSMASPHVAGVVALYLEKNPKAKPADIDALVKANGTPNAVRRPGAGSPNLMIFTNPDSSLAGFGG